MRSFDRLGETDRIGGPRIAFVVKRPLGPHYTRMAQENGIAILDPTPALEELRREGNDSNGWPVTSRHRHWNHSGHAAIASFLTTQVRALIDRKAS